MVSFKLVHDQHLLPGNKNFGMMIQNWLSIEDESQTLIPN